MSAHPGIDGLAGAISGMASVFVGHPLDTLRTKAQVHTGNSSSWAIAKKMVANEGVAGLFRGVLPPLFAVGLGKPTCTQDSAVMYSDEPE